MRSGSFLGCATVFVWGISKRNPRSTANFFRSFLNLCSCRSDQWALELKPETRRTTMSRKLTLTLTFATVATIAAVSLGSNAAEARGFVGGFRMGSAHFGGAHFGGGFRMGGAHLGGAHFGGGSRLGGGRQMGGQGGRLADNKGRGGEHEGGAGRGALSGRAGFHNGGHWVLRDGRWIVLADAPVLEPVDAPVVEPADAAITESVSANPSGNCLTKTYTASGLVVFADICTKEAASAPVGDGPTSGQEPPVAGKSSDATQMPTSPNYAGVNYKQFLAAQKN
jgi:hypothetical protein